MTDIPSKSPAKPGPRSASPTTLALDIGGTGLKASVLDAEANLVADRLRVATTYPCPPEQLVAALVGLAQQLPGYDRVSAGFPGMVRRGRILSAPHFVTRSGPGSKIDADLVRAWDHFDLAAALAGKLGKPTRVANDADVQGAAVVTGSGLEVVMTLGTGMGTAIFDDGRLMPHLELAHHPFRKRETYDEQIGEAARKRIGDKEWSARVHMAIRNLDALLFFDHLFIGGGNSRRLNGHPGPNVTIIDNVAGLVGGVKIWDQPEMHEEGRPQP
jgi:polyphosphate glucokinase